MEWDALPGVKGDVALPGNLSGPYLNIPDSCGFAPELLPG